MKPDVKLPVGKPGISNKVMIFRVYWHDTNQCFESKIRAILKNIK